ncbi:beta-1,4-galactosyltransferase 6-like, partial [Pecten maximus]|uniref:beta-1,4-galactosyltransferase 6-like n=1 Tax=Pecten maximus TaxID=6579 RepID=UPI00145912FE
MKSLPVNYISSNRSCDLDRAVKLVKHRMAASSFGRVKCHRNKLIIYIIVSLIIVELIVFLGLYSKHDIRTIFRCRSQKISEIKRSLLVVKVPRNCTGIKIPTHEKKNTTVKTAVNDTLPKCQSSPPHGDINIPNNCTTIMMLTAEKKNTSHTLDIIPKCPSAPPNRVGCLNTHFPSPSFTELITLLDHLKPGGRYTPPNCVTDQRVAIVIPYRNREQHLRTVLFNLHLLLGTQQIDYGIFVIEQAGQNTFNRGALMNIGFAEAIKTYNYTCFVFHDVDLVPEDDRIFYGCGKTPRHLSVAID